MRAKITLKLMGLAVLAGTLLAGGCLFLGGGDNGLLVTGKALLG